MTASVSERCRTIATYRHIGVSLMETVARWTPSTPEMEAKVMFGRHIWDFAQMADALGNRTFELRQPKHHSLPPVDEFGKLLLDVSSVQLTGDRVAALYEGILPGLIKRLRCYTASTDSILDEPSIVIIDRIVHDLERQRVEAYALQGELGLESTVAAELAAREARVDNIVSEHLRP